MPPISPSISQPTSQTLVDPLIQGHLYTLDLGNGLTFVANGETGRITQLNFGGCNLLTDESVNVLNYGSSFWTAPQSTWGWPPPLDAASYAHRIDGKSILFTSDATMQAGELVSVSKRFSADGTSGKLFLEYRIKNEGSLPIRVAPWEITRLKASGLTFYPTGNSITQAELTTVNVGGITWLDYETAGLAGSGLKNATDGAEGWLAHVSDGILFLKSFSDIPAGSEAPNEGEIEIYVDGDRAYVELEQQGALITLAPGAVSEPWLVTWQAVSLTADLEVAVGCQALVAFARSLIG